MRSIIVALILIFIAVQTWAAQSEDIILAKTDLTELSLEELMNIEVTSVSKRPQRLFEAAAAVHVITSEDIRRSGARSIPEALRLAPGVSVAQNDANKWAVAVRGFNERFTEMLLVLFDGRSVYSPTMSGVFWDMQHYPLEDIDRIEVIRGPGGTLWGANAVNGVINIITKDAKDTVGSYISGGAGSEERGFTTIRHGHRISENGFIRGYVDYFSIDDMDGGFDERWLGQGGFRGDWDWSGNHFTIQGDYYRGQERQLEFVPSFTEPFRPLTQQKFDVAGGNVLARYKHQMGEHSDLQLQLYYDRTEREEITLAGTRDTFDLDYQHRFPVLPGHDFIYGLGFRYFQDNFFNDPSRRVFYLPGRSNHELYSGFVQDEIALFEDRFRLTLGTKLEYNDFTGWEVQPNIRGIWLNSPRHVLWAAVSRAVQVPGRDANDIKSLLPIEPIPPSAALSLPTFFEGRGNTSIESQELIAYEAGFRVQPSDQLSMEVAGFFNDYEKFLTGEAGLIELGDPPNHFISPSLTINGGTGRSFGFEITADWRPTDTWRLVGTWSFLDIEFDDFAIAPFAEGNDPRTQFSLRSSLDLPGNIELDLWGRFVDDLSAFAAENVEDYFDMDARLSWRPKKGVEVALVGQNLWESERFEFGQNPFTPTVISAVQRSFYVQISYGF